MLSKETCAEHDLTLSNASLFKSLFGTGRSISAHSNLKSRLLKEVQWTARVARVFTSAGLRIKAFVLFIASLGDSPTRKELSNSATTVWQRVQCSIKCDCRPSYRGSLCSCILPQHPASLQRNKEMTWQRTSMFMSSVPWGTNRLLVFKSSPRLIGAS